VSEIIQPFAKLPYRCPHCNTVRPDYRIEFRNDDAPPVGQIALVTIFCAGRLERRKMSDIRFCAPDMDMREKTGKPPECGAIFNVQFLGARAQGGI
jgi:hypothetical protein